MYWAIVIEFIHYFRSSAYLIFGWAKKWPLGSSWLMKEEVLPQRTSRIGAVVMLVSSLGRDR